MPFKRLFLILTIFVSGCNLNENQTTVYQRVNGSDFEREQGMNQTAKLTMGKEPKIEICSDWGCTAFFGKSLNNSIKFEDLDIRIDKETLSVSQTDSDTWLDFEQIK